MELDISWFNSGVLHFVTLIKSCLFSSMILIIIDFE